MCCRTVPKRTGPYQVWSFLARRTDQTDEHLHHTDHLDPNLPLWNVVQDLYSTGPAQETCDAAVGYAHYIRLSPTRQHELDHTDHTDQEYICPQRNRLSNRFYKKLKNVSCEYDRLNGWNSSLQAAWYIRRVRIIWFLWTKPTIRLLILSFTQNIVRACSMFHPHQGYRSVICWRLNARTRRVHENTSIFFNVFFFWN